MRTWLDAAEVYVDHCLDHGTFYDLDELSKVVRAMQKLRREEVWFELKEKILRRAPGLE